MMIIGCDYHPAFQQIAVNAGRSLISLVDPVVGRTNSA